MKKELIQRLHKSFEDCAHQNEGVEFWLARELQELLGYTQWRNFEAVIDKAKMACAKAGQAVSDHFADVSKMIDLAKGAQREVDDHWLTFCQRSLSRPKISSMKLLTPKSSSKTCRVNPRLPKSTSKTILMCASC